ncbi:uncharacterized protein LOC122327479 isoform X2 [Puntigrus tetrazona]|uniref:uncharacterized protein LOC122327479 isoform X2 n=1 Tax=Puntigrus tetrazona TaxID=1606681 RepID=UPI001C8A8CFE|nr:uncharacterized protein LOC122327479 isoform X2 [Puntigrus tetrazona]
MRLLFNSLAGILFLIDHGASGAGSDVFSVSPKIGDSVVFYTDIQCNSGPERFRDRLKLDNQTGSLTILNTKTTDSGEYLLQAIRSSSSNDKIFNVDIRHVHATKLDEVQTNEGQCVILDSGEIRNNDHVMTWFFKDGVIARITGGPSETCTDVRCEDGDERFRDRVMLDHQSGSLIIKDTRNTDSGDYKLQIVIRNSSFVITRVKRFSVSITAVQDLGPSSGAVADISFAVLLVVAALTAGVIESS